MRLFIWLFLGAFYAVGLVLLALAMFVAAMFYLAAHVAAWFVTLVVGKGDQA